MSDERCETCEHEHDSSSEYCGGCDDTYSCWQEAGWIKDREIARLNEALAAERQARDRAEAEVTRLTAREKGLAERLDWQINNLVRMVDEAVASERQARERAEEALKFLREAEAWRMHCMGHHNKDNRAWRDLPEEERELWRKKVDAYSVELAKNGAITALSRPAPAEPAQPEPGTPLARWEKLGQIVCERGWIDEFSSKAWESQLVEMLDALISKPAQPAKGKEART